MKVALLHRDHDFKKDQPFPWNVSDIISDLELNTLLAAMAGEDEYLPEVCKRVVLTYSGNDIDTIVYRQDVLRDCRKNEEVIKQFYDITLEAVELKKKYGFGIFISSRPSSILYDAISMIERFTEILKTLRNLGTQYKKQFSSEGFNSLFARLEEELTDDYLATVLEEVDDLKLRDGLLMSAYLGKANKGTGYVLHRLRVKRLAWYRQLFAKKPDIYTYNVHPRDEGGARALDELKNRAINNSANDLAQSVDHILNFFISLRYELAFYIACLNLERQLEALGLTVSFPTPVMASEPNQFYMGLYDACLALSLKQKVVANEADIDGKNPIVITGANQGGKSTFLRSIGLAQVMMQAGMFIAADYGKIGVCDGVITHFKREEDTELKSGKFDEELSRMNIIADKVTPGSRILFNESFASTNEGEGSEVAEQIVQALIENGTRVFFVTHLYELAHNLEVKMGSKAMFLRAERNDEQQRTFKLKTGAPLPTSYGMDLYDKIFTEKQKTDSYGDKAANDGRGQSTGTATDSGDI